jgi:hypothetical protein
MRTSLLLPVFLLLPRCATRDEPRPEDVVRGAGTFVEGKVRANEKGKEVTRTCSSASRRRNRRSAEAVQRCAAASR